MQIRLNDDDKIGLEALEETRRNNFDVLELLSRLLCTNSRAIKGEDVREIAAECNVTEEYAYYALLAAAFGLDAEDGGRGEVLSEKYLRPAVRCLNTAEFEENPYYKHIKIPKVSIDSWRLGEEEYAPYEAFICDDICLERGLKEVPRLGFFTEKFSFPCVYENGREWMAIKPNEIATMRQPIEKAHGDVVTFGLGLGYFAYMVSLKEDVKSVTVVERDKRVIRLFKEYVLPQFEYAGKVKIVVADAYEYAVDLSKKGHDFAFVDLWHDASDGVQSYLNMKKIEVLNPDIDFCYWIEPTLLSYVRWRVYEDILEAVKRPQTDGEVIDGIEGIMSYLSNDNLSRIAPFLRP